MVAFYILIGIACIFLILIVLVQNPKGGGLSSTFASSNQILGVKKTNDFLEKATWTLAIAVAVFCIISSVGTSNSELIHSDLENRILNDVPALPEGVLPETAPAVPAEDLDLPVAEND